MLAAVSEELHSTVVALVKNLHDKDVHPSRGDWPQWYLVPLTRSRPDEGMQRTLLLCTPQAGSVTR